MGLRCLAARRVLRDARGPGTAIERGHRDVDRGGVSRDDEAGGVKLDDSTGGAAGGRPRTGPCRLRHWLLGPV